MADGFHPPLEEYLEAIHELEEEGTQVIQARLAERLGHSAPAVSEIIRRLKSEGYVTVDDRAVHLTDKGRTRAESVVRKHRLAERLLTEIIGLPWHKAHVEACRWEHVISDEVEDRLFELLGHPTACPHGNPIPRSGAQPVADLVALSELHGGEQVRLRAGHRAGRDRPGGARATCRRPGSSPARRPGDGHGRPTVPSPWCSASTPSPWARRWPSSCT